MADIGCFGLRSLFQKKKRDANSAPLLCTRHSNMAQARVNACFVRPIHRREMFARTPVPIPLLFLPSRSPPSLGPVAGDESCDPLPASIAGGSAAVRHA